MRILGNALCFSGVTLASAPKGRCALLGTPVSEARVGGETALGGVKQGSVARPPRGRGAGAGGVGVCEAVPAHGAPAASCEARLPGAAPVEGGSPPSGGAPGGAARPASGAQVLPPRGRPPGRPALGGRAGGPRAQVWPARCCFLLGAARARAASFLAAGHPLLEGDSLALIHPVARV